MKKKTKNYPQKNCNSCHYKKSCKLWRFYYDGC